MKKLYWFTGQAGAGKTVLANLLKKHFEEKDEEFSAFGDIASKYVIIDGDDIRAIYENKDYSILGRKANVDFVQKAMFISNKEQDNSNSLYGKSICETT